MAKGKPIVDLLAHFLSKLIPDYEDDHWSLDTALNNKGYHVLCVGDGQKKYGHVVSYELFIGVIPEGMEVDHVCRTTWCCNPDHLEAVTHAENLRRAYPRCKQGHDLTDPANRYIRPSSSTAGGMCRPCQNRRNANRPPPTPEQRETQRQYKRRWEAARRAANKRLNNN